MQVYRDSGIYKAAIKAHPDEPEFAEWLARAAPSGGVDLSHAYSEWHRRRQPAGAEIRLIGWDGDTDILPMAGALRAVARAETFLTRRSLVRFREIRVYGGPGRRWLVARWQHGTDGWARQ